MEFFFKPLGIAVIGASPKPKKRGNNILVNLIKGFQGGIYPVNPQYPEIEEQICYPSVSAVPDPVDLAIIFIAAPLVPDVVRECAHRGIKGVIIQSAGFSEAGDGGLKLHQKIVQIVQETGIRVWGPNCMGMVDVKRRNVFSFMLPSSWETNLLPGNVSLIVQSGLLSSIFAIDAMSHGTTGLSKVCSIGNKLDVNECDVLEYLINDPDTGAVGMYLESIPDGRRFAALCRRSEKPLVVLMGGKSEAGVKAAISHTGSMAGNGAIISGVLAQTGVIEAHDFKQMLDICRTLSMYPRLAETATRRVAVLTFSGGAGIVSSDFIAETGLRLATFSPETLEQLKQIFPEWMPPANPLDIFAAIDKKGVQTVLWTSILAVMSDPNVDATLYQAPLEQYVSEPGAKFLSSAGTDFDKPFIMWASGEAKATADFQNRMLAKGVPIFRELYRAVECLAAVFRYHEMRTALSSESSSQEHIHISEDCMQMIANGHGVLNEYSSKQVLSAIAIPIAEDRRVVDASDAKHSAADLGYPVVLKGMIPGEVHKTEMGLVKLGITSEEVLDNAYSDLRSRMPERAEVLVQKHVKGDLELIAGLVRDPQFGPCVMLGLGGVMAEILDDKAFAVAPITRAEAYQMIDRLKHQKVLNGFRGATPVDREALVQVLMKLGALGISCPQIREIDINPLIVSNGLPVAVDASVILD